MALVMRGEPAAATPAQLWFPGTAAAVSQARRFVAGVIGDGCPALDDVLVLVSEVASNAVKHTASGDGGAFEVAVWVTGGSVRVEIGDQGGASEPRLAEDGPVDALTGGRGLRIVDTLAAKWGHAGDELGRVVWFEVHNP
jgi:serine/threonine-protein kinase RsbW